MRIEHGRRIAPSRQDSNTTAQCGPSPRRRRAAALWASGPLARKGRAVHLYHKVAGLFGRLTYNN